jgi:recombination protein RecT
MTTKNAYTASGNALAKPAEQRDADREDLNRHNSYFLARLPQLTKWVTGGVKPEALIRFALLDLQQNKKLRECDPQSIFLGLLACATCGLEPGSLKAEAYLVPFAGKAQFIPGYRGLIKMARRSRDVLSISAEVVYEHDEFSIMLGTEPSIRHSPELRGERGGVLGAYAVARLAGGGIEHEWMDYEQLEQVRGVAEKRGKSPAWSEWTDEMRKKTCLRRLCKRLPLHNDYYNAAHIEQASDDGRPVADVLDVLTEGAATQSTGKAPQMSVPGDVTPDEVAAITAAEAKER